MQLDHQIYVISMLRKQYKGNEWSLLLTRLMHAPDTIKLRLQILILLNLL